MLQPWKSPIPNELKPKFAAELLRLGDPNKAAFALLPSNNDTGLAMHLAKLWADDPQVLAEMGRLMQDSTLAKSLLPSKEMQAKDIYAIAQDPRIEVKERLAAHRLYAEVLGHIEKQAAGNVTNVLNQGVMVIKDHGSDDDWEKKAVKQQRTLTLNASN